MLILHTISQYIIVNHLSAPKTTVRIQTQYLPSAHSQILCANNENSVQIKLSATMSWVLFLSAVNIASHLFSDRWNDRKLFVLRYLLNQELIRIKLQCYNKVCTFRNKTKTKWYNAYCLFIVHCAIHCLVHWSLYWCTCIHV